MDKQDKIHQIEGKILDLQKELHVLRYNKSSVDEYIKEEPVRDRGFGLGKKLVGMIKGKDNEVKR